MCIRRSLFLSPFDLIPAIRVHRQATARAPSTSSAALAGASGADGGAGAFAALPSSGAFFRRHSLPLLPENSKKSKKKKMGWNRA